MGQYFNIDNWLSVEHFVLNRCIRKMTFFWLLVKKENKQQSCLRKLVQFLINLGTIKYVEKSHKESQVNNESKAK